MAEERATVAIIAGPNGSGKSTFYREFLRDAFPVFVNADEIAAHLAGVPQDRSLEAARQAEAARNRLLEQRATFALETVFSRREYWLQFILRCQAQGNRVWLYFICTETPAINVFRIGTRVEQGGHSVPPDKVQERYPKSLRTAVGAKDLVDELWLYDNSRLARTHRLVARFVQGKALDVSHEIPRWAQSFFES